MSLSIGTEAQRATTPQSQMGSTGLVHYSGSTPWYLHGEFGGEGVDHLSI